MLLVVAVWFHLKWPLIYLKEKDRYWIYCMQWFRIWVDDCLKTMLLKQQHLISFSMRKDLYTRHIVIVSACTVVHISPNKHFPLGRIQKNPNYKSTALNLEFMPPFLKRCASTTQFASIYYAASWYTNLVTVCNCES